MTGSLADRTRLSVPAPGSPALRFAARWLWVAWLLGGTLRALLVVFSEGTLDVPIWEAHARSISERGLVATYRGGPYLFNHPPLAGLLEARLWELCQATGLPFRIALRAPTALIDAGTTWLLVQLLARSGSRKLRDSRHLLGALYWLSPLAILFSAQHGNTDPAVACSLLGALLLIVCDRPGLAGAVFGLGLSIKIPGLLALPALLLALPGWKARLRFGASSLAVTLAAFLPFVWPDPETALQAVYLYPGLRLQTTSGQPIWTLSILLAQVAEWQPALRGATRAVARFHHTLNTPVCLSCIALFAWSRRRELGPEAVGFTLAGSFAILYGLSSSWAFQYLAWSLPLWAFAGWRLGLAAGLIASTYVYFLYAWLCGDWLLFGHWDFIGKPDWPIAIRILRDAAWLFFLVTAVSLLVASVRRERAHWRAPTAVG